MPKVRQKWWNGSRSTAFIATLLMAEMEELSRQFGMEMERFKYQTKKDDLGAVALVMDLAKALERVSLPVVWPGRRTSASHGRSCGCCVGTSSTRGEGSLKDVWRSRWGPSQLSCQGQSGVVCFCVLY